MGEENKDDAFQGGEVLFAGGTDWGFIGRTAGGGKKGKEVMDQQGFGADVAAAPFLTVDVGCCTRRSMPIEQRSSQTWLPPSA